MKDIISDAIQIWICVGAFISVAYVIPSYLQTNWAFILSQKPALLLQAIDNLSTSEHFTRIHYENCSNNPFYDLSIFVKVTTSHTKVDLSDLFTKNMYMAPHDSRDRMFSTVNELKKRGFDLISSAQQNQEIILSIAYEFTYNRKTEVINVQEYFWDTSNQKPSWTIR
jgi:hypothetical protein